MLGKLIKYDFAATSRTFLPFFGATVAAACISRLIRELGGINTASVIGTVISSLLIGAICVIAFVLCIMHFKRNLTGDEGYLMHTLPARVDHLIISKLIVSAVWFIAAAVTATLAILMLAVEDLPGLLRGFSHALSQLFKAYGAYGALLIFELLLTALFAAASQILILYVCITVPMTVTRRRGLMGFGLWIGISIVSQALASIAVAVAIATDFTAWLTQRLSQRGLEQLLYAGVILFFLADCALMYFITRQMLRRHLNLE